MSFYRDKQIKGFCSFLIIYSLLLLIAGFSLGMSQIHHVKSLYLTHDEAMASSLLEQGVSRGVIAAALNNSEISDGACWSLLVWTIRFKIVCHLLSAACKRICLVPFWRLLFFLY